MVSHTYSIPLAILPKVLLLGVLALASSACGNLTAGGFGEAAVTVSGDVPETSAAAPAKVASLAAAASDDDDEPEGEVEVEFMLFLEGADGSSTALSTEDLRVRVDLRGRQEADVVNRQVEAKRYTGLRIVFTEIEAEVDAGLVINGQVVSGAIEVELEDVTLTVIRPISLTIEDGDRVELVVDLNAATWLQAVDPDLNKVAEGAFANALSLVIR